MKIPSRLRMDYFLCNIKKECPRILSINIPSYSFFNQEDLQVAILRMVFQIKEERGKQESNSPEFIKNER